MEADSFICDNLLAFPPAAHPRLEVCMSPFRIFKLRTDGSPHVVEEAQTLEDAIERVEALAELWPGEYIIQNEETGERVFITAGSKPS
jgi:hypothetical protein